LGLVFGFLQKVSIFNGEARSDDVGGTESMLPLTARLPATAHLTSETKSSLPHSAVCTEKTTLDATLFSNSGWNIQIAEAAGFKFVFLFDACALDTLIGT
jgi:hypothetical protein